MHAHTTHSLWRGLLLAALILAAAPAIAEPLHLQSPAEQVAVVELFTSHGCSSCPPADRWLRGLREHPGLWQEVIPLAFHVDYWDYLGWPDRFARRAFTRRQEAYERSGALSQVYTPGFVIKGEEWRRYFFWSSPDLEPGPLVGRLSLEVEAGEGASLRFAPTGKHGPLRAHQAVLGMGLASAIGRGENSGKTLEEDFVVLGVSHAEANTARQWALDWPMLKPAEPERYAVVAWVSKADDPRPLQAVGGWLPRGK